MDSNSIIDAHQNLPEWVSNFDKRFLSKLDLKERGHQYFNDTYKACFNIRDDFRNNFLPKLESDLGFPSSSKYYKYEYFFKSQDYPEFELSNNYYYDNNINLLKKNYSCANIKKKETNINIDKRTKEEEKVNIINKSSQINKEKNIITDNKTYLKNKNVNSNINNNAIKYDNKINNNMINKNNNQIYKKNEINNQFQKNIPKIQNKNIEIKKEQIYKNSSIVKNNIIKNNNKYENIYTEKIEKETKIEKKNIPNSASKIKINTIYNKNIIPIREELNENDEDTQINISSKSSQKMSNKTNQNNNIYPQSQNTINKNKIYTKTPINRKSNENNFSKNSENLKSNTKRGSIKNYISAKNSNILENENILDEKPTIKASNNINHTHIKNYFRNTNNEEDEKVGELGINIRKGNNNTQMNKRIMRESKSSYDVFKKTPVKK